MNNTVQILVNDRPIKIIGHNNKLFIESRNSTEYKIKIKNNYSSRIMACVSVDGLDVLTGELAGNSQSGYIISAFFSYEIPGWRVSNDKCNAFKFSSKDRSYAAKSEITNGDTRNCGCLGIRIFKEKTIQYSISNQFPNTFIWPYFPSEPYKEQTTWNHDKIYGRKLGSSDNSQMSYCDTYGTSSNNYNSNNIVSCNSLVTNSLDQSSFDLGTEFSNKEIIDVVTNTTFEKGELLEEIIIFYASKQNLLNMGVPLYSEPKIYIPQAFPKGNFCKPPKF